MKFKSGSKVEILSEKGIPAGSWRLGEIVCGNGHSYTVRYDGYAGIGDEVVMERVSREAIRPCPPPPEVSENWVPGDVVEVFYDFSWRMATISKVLDKDYFLVRLLGSYVELEVCKFEVRTRQSWEDDKWVVIGKSSGNCFQMTRARTYVHMKDNFVPLDEEKLQRNNIAPCRTLKRRLCGYSQVEGFDGTAKKFRATEKEGSRRVIAADESHFTEQVDGIAFPRERLIGEFIHSSLDNRNGYSEIEAERRSNGAVLCSFATDLQPDAAESVSCSVGSCSISGYNSHKLYYHARCDGDDGCFSDAESFCQREYGVGDHVFLKKEGLAAEIHRLELHAYRCTIEALYASGPLSWDQEAMMTNLRLSLHISNDEHLMEVRNLVSAGNSIRSR